MPYSTFQPHIMVARCNELVGDLEKGKKEETLAALKKVKNQIIGNKTKKKAFLECGAVPAILKILSTSDNAELQVQAAAALGSFGCGSPDQLDAAQKHESVMALVRTLYSSNARVVEAGVRAIKLIFQAGQAPRDPIIDPDVVCRLMQLMESAAVSVVASLTGIGPILGAFHPGIDPMAAAQRLWITRGPDAKKTSKPQSTESAVPEQQQQGEGQAEAGEEGVLSPDVADAVAAVLAHCCTNTQEQQALTSAGAVYGLCVLLMSKRRPSQAAALAALSPLLYNNPAACLELVHAMRSKSPFELGSASTTAPLMQHLQPLSTPTSAAAATNTIHTTTSLAAAAAAAEASVTPKPLVSPHAFPNATALVAAEAIHALSAQDACPALNALLSLLRDQSPEVRLLSASCITHLAASCPTSPKDVSTSEAGEAGTTAGASGEGGPGGGSFRGELVERERGLAGLVLAFGGGIRGGKGAGAAPVEEMRESGGKSSSSSGRKCASDESKQQPSSTGSPQVLSVRLEDARRAALPVLLQLLSNPAWAQAVPMVLSTLIENSEELQKAATDADAVRALAALLPLPNAGPRVREGVLRALGSLCMSRDEVRRQLIEAKVMEHIIQGLRDPADGVRGAGALCVMALSRSVKTLRSSLLDTDVAEALCKLLGDPNPDVQVNAAAAVCNLVLEFNAVKSSVLAQGALEKLTTLACSMSAPLRLHSCWALRNLAYKSDASVRRALMQGLPWSAMRCLLSDPEEGVQEQAICTLRNLCMDAPDHITAAFDWAGPDLLAAMEEKLDPCRDANPKLRQHALYTVVNILTGSEAHKEAVATSNLPTLLLHHMRTSTNPEVRLPAVWCVINMTWPDANSAAGVAARARRLKELGAEDVLLVLQSDTSLDMRERVKTALEQIRSALPRQTGSTGAEFVAP